MVHTVDSACRSGSTTAERLGEIVGNNRRYQLPLLRSQLELPGEAWPILGELGALYAERSDPAQAQPAEQEAAAIIRRLAEAIDDQELREGFVTAVPARAVFQHSDYAISPSPKSN